MDGSYGTNWGMSQQSESLCFVKEPPPWSATSEPTEWSGCSAQSLLRAYGLPLLQTNGSLIAPSYTVASSSSELKSYGHNSPVGIRLALLSCSPTSSLNALTSSPQRLPLSFMLWHPQCLPSGCSPRLPNVCRRKATSETHGLASSFML